MPDDKIKQAEDALLESLSQPPETANYMLLSLPSTIPDGSWIIGHRAMLIETGGSEI